MAIKLKQGERRVTKWRLRNILVDKGEATANLPEGTVLEFCRVVTDHSTFYEFQVVKSSLPALVGQLCWLSRREVAEDTRPE